MTLLELLPKLSEPFPSTELRWRVGTVSKDKKRVQALPYAEPRVYEDRLNALCPGEWSVSFRPWSDDRIICELTICNVTRSSTGEANAGGMSPGTSAEAQAFKRACSKFGLGRFLYSIPTKWVAYDADKKTLAEMPKLSSPAPVQPQREPADGPGRPGSAANRQPAKSAPATLSRERACAMHLELSKLGLKRDEHYQVCERTLGREVKSLTTLTDDEALAVWNAARREASERIAASRRPVSDAEAQVVLN